MIPVQEINLLYLQELETPQVAFEMVMEYAAKTRTDTWTEFGRAFSAHSITVVLEHGGRLIGYCNAEIDRDGNLYLNHGFLRRGVRVDNVDVLMELIFFKMTDNMGDNRPKKMLMHHRGPTKLWQRWGFKESPLKIYEKDMGGNNNG
jgi:hypothetical protein